jgi:short-subunit dehydrogenase
MKKNNLKDSTVWITGASTGIGLEMALGAARSGARLHLFSSRMDVLEEAAHTCTHAGAAAVHFEAVDLSDITATVLAAEGALEISGPPDYLILNAGVSQRSLAAETDLSVTGRVMNLNFFGAVAVARTVLPAMVAKGGGHIGVTTSFTGVFGFPLRSSYAASKHALKGYFESVGLEYGSRGIRVTVAVPGRVRTSISSRALTGDGTPHGKSDPGLEKGIDSADCAKKYWKAVIRGQREVVISGFDSLMVFFYRFLYPLFKRIATRVSPV